MSKLVLTVLAGLVFIFIVLGMAFDGISLNKSSQLSCKNDLDVQNGYQALKVSIILQGWALFFVFFLVIFAIFWNYRRLEYYAIMKERRKIASLKSI